MLFRSCVPDWNGEKHSQGCLSPLPPPNPPSSAREEVLSPSEEQLGSRQTYSTPGLPRRGRTRCALTDEANKLPNSNDVVGKLAQRENKERRLTCTIAALCSSHGNAVFLCFQSFFPLCLLRCSSTLLHSRHPTPSSPWLSLTVFLLLRERQDPGRIPILCFTPTPYPKHLTQIGRASCRERVSSPV